MTGQNCVVAHFLSEGTSAGDLALWLQSLDKREIDSLQGQVPLVGPGRILFEPVGTKNAEGLVKKFSADVDSQVLCTSGGVLGTIDGSEVTLTKGAVCLVAAGQEFALRTMDRGGETGRLLIAQVDGSVEGSAALTEIGYENVTSTAPYYWGYDDRYAQTYAAGGNTWETVQPNPWLLEALKTAPPPPGGNIADLGCGEGRDSLHMARLGYNVAAIDVSPAALDVARQRARDEELEISFLTSDVTRLEGLPADQFDWVVNMGCLHMLDDREHRRSHLDRVRDILAPTGRFVLSHCTERWLEGFYSVVDYDPELATPGRHIPRRIRTDDGEKIVDMEVLRYKESAEGELIAEVEAAGFKVESSASGDGEDFGTSLLAIFKKSDKHAMSAEP